MSSTLLLLAAGESRRMAGRDKLIEDVNGLPCLRAMALRGLEAGFELIVPLPGPDTLRATALRGLAVSVVYPPAAPRGMAASICAGMEALAPGTRDVTLLPADMPGIETADLIALRSCAAKHPEALIIQAATEHGLPGHPVLFRERLFPELRTLTGDRGARAVIDRNEAHRRLLPRPGERARLDLDTPEDWARWRARQHESGPEETAGRWCKNWRPPASS